MNDSTGNCFCKLTVRDIGLLVGYYFLGVILFLFLFGPLIGVFWIGAYLVGSGFIGGDPLVKNFWVAYFGCCLFVAVCFFAARKAGVLFKMRCRKWFSNVAGIVFVLTTILIINSFGWSAFALGGLTLVPLFFVREGYGKILKEKGISIGDA